MIEYINGNLLVLETQNCFILHGCNSKGSMGAGIAKQIKDQFPEVFDVYKNDSRMMGTYTSFHYMDRDLIFVNLITQDSYGRDSKKRYVDYDAVKLSLVQFVRDLTKLSEYGYQFPKRIAFPRIGAGLGGGDWTIIEKIIDETIPDTYQKVCYVL